MNRSFLYLINIARVPDLNLSEAGEEVNIPEVYIVEDNGDLRPGIIFSCQVCVTAQKLLVVTPPLILSQHHSAYMLVVPRPSHHYTLTDQCVGGQWTA